MESDHPASCGDIHRYICEPSFPSNHLPFYTYIQKETVWNDKKIWTNGWTTTTAILIKENVR
ncbi:hypothetical protein VIBNISOn1_1630008 [Vibrio nigripulchritudo SOn1]|uniref:Uncharacterized protein n=1 Tax=Vibrio nigripulchritudo SOn1 TaxID=1238450 RepID=A0AAV2VN83_9VIBR|nr:hypothetical protein VIBNISOn1_1630008 [Vibrio nigripulchritudo SOn1]